MLQFFRFFVGEYVTLLSTQLIRELNSSKVSNGAAFGFVHYPNARWIRKAKHNNEVKTFATLNCL